VKGDSWATLQTAPNQIARGTLTRVGVKLHTFTSCPPSVSAHKEAYFDLLRALKAARHELDDPNLRREC
jgi:hypothetical protein